MDGELNESKALCLQKTGGCVGGHKGGLDADCSASAERIEHGRSLFLTISESTEVSVPIASVKKGGCHELAHDGLGLALSVGTS